MTEQNQIYKCEACGNMVEVLHKGVGELTCCNQPMTLFTAETEDGAREKHLPVVEEQSDSVKIKVGDVAHPMEDKHYIEWIQVITKDGMNYKKFLNPCDAPEAEFQVAKDNIKYVREYCNLHGLWRISF